MQKLLSWKNALLGFGLVVVAGIIVGLVLYLNDRDDWHTYVRDAVDSYWGARSEQNWTGRQQNWFYNTSQGSQLIDYDWMLHLEQPENDQPFLADGHMGSLGYITRKFDPNDPDRTNHLPVGFVKDESNDIRTGNPKSSLGLTCAACHTNDLKFEGETIRIDGGGSLANGPLFIARLTQSVTNTALNDAKFDRFANRVLDDGESKDDLRTALNKYMDERQSYEFRNTDSTTTVEGYGRFDAFGRIFNRVLHFDGADPPGAVPTNFNPINAPVSYPFLWGTNQSDWVQWVGSVGNGGVGPLTRNTGEVLGVFADVDINPPNFTIGYPSSVKAFNLIALEKRMRKLRSPVWPEDIFGPINQESADRGSAIYQASCAVCHNIVDRTDEKREVIAWMERLDTIGTDPTTANNISGPSARTGKTGDLQGRDMIPLKGPKLASVAPVGDILTNVAANVLARNPLAIIKQEIISVLQGRGALSDEADKKGNFKKDKPLLAYKARSLGGVWATAPYLHNGSVASLWELLTIPGDRLKEFYVGSGEYDPINVGVNPDVKPPFEEFKFSTHDVDGDPITGNSNAGHVYGTGLTDQEKWDLIEYMKTDMGPAN